jgi:predicted transcriptional regulator YdeE
MHAVYYNYDESKTSFDMLIGVMTQDDAAQTNQDLVTLTIPAQNYQYVSVQ